MKTTIGYFINVDTKKQYNIYFQKGFDGWRNSQLEVGNCTYGVFFRFGYDDDYIFVYNRTRKTYSCRAVELKYPEGDDDVEEILNMLLLPAGLKLVSLEYKSRKMLRSVDLIKDI